MDKLHVVKGVFFPFRPGCFLCRGRLRLPAATSDKCQIKESKDTGSALEECLAYISERKSELKVLFSDHAEHYLSGACLEIINKKVMQRVLSTSAPDRQDEFLLCAAASASAIYGFIQIWLTKDINKTPGELAVILRKSFNDNVFL